MSKKVSKKKRATKRVTTPRTRTVTRSVGILPTKKTKSSVDPRRWIMMFFGQPGIGKTTFVNSFSDRVLFMSTDRGTEFMEAMSVDCATWGDFLKYLSALEKNNNSQNYEFVCVDHAGDWAAMAELYVLKKYGVEALADLKWGKGWAAYKKELRSFMMRLRKLNIGLIFVAHETTKDITVNGIDVNRCQPDLPKAAWDNIIPLTHMVGYCGSRPVKLKGNRIHMHTLETTPRQDLFVKDRTSRIRTSNRPAGREWEELDGAKFRETFQEIR